MPTYDDLEDELFWEDIEDELLESADGDEEEDGPRPASPAPSLAQMERDGEEAARIIDRMLAEDPNTPSNVILAEIRKVVRPMGEYRPTEAELAAIRSADIMHTLRGAKRRIAEEDENDSQEEDL